MPSYFCTIPKHGLRQICQKNAGKKIQDPHGQGCCISDAHSIQGSSMGNSDLQMMKTDVGFKAKKAAGFTIGA